MEPAFLAVLLSRSGALHPGSATGALTAAAADQAPSGQQPSLLLSHWFSCRRRWMVLSIWAIMAAETGVPAILRRISVRLSGRLAEMLCIEGWDSKLEMDYRGRGGSKLGRIFVLLSLFPELIVESLDPHLQPIYLVAHLVALVLEGVSAYFDGLQLLFGYAQLIA